MFGVALAQAGDHRRSTQYNRLALAAFKGLGPKHRVDAADSRMCLALGLIALDQMQEVRGLVERTLEDLVADRVELDRYQANRLFKLAQAWTAVDSEQAYRPALRGHGLLEGLGEHERKVQIEVWLHERFDTGYAPSPG